MQLATTLIATHGNHISYLQAIVLGLLQGVTELFPISSLGHSVLIPALLGWHNLVGSQTADTSFFLTFVVGLHLGTAIGLILYYRRTWVTLAGGLVSSVKERSIAKPAQRLIWLLILGTIPVGVVGLVLEHTLRKQFAKPLSASIFLMVNGLILFGAELLRRRSLARAGMSTAKGLHTKGQAAAVSDEVATVTYNLETLPLSRGVAIGASQILGLIAGISRSGANMAAGLLGGLDHEDAAQFSFLLATPVILAAALLKLPELFGPLGNGIRGQCLVGAIAAGVAGYFSVKFLVRWFETKTLWPFAVYCLIVGGACAIYFS